MAMPSGNVVISDKPQFVAGVGGEIPQTHYHQWFPDERDGFISWMRAEFAAANSIIDSLCHHLRTVSDPGEYDAVIGSIQQRRFNWNSVLHGQQYFSVQEIMYALQQVEWRKQNRYFDNGKGGGKEFKRSGMGFRQQGPRSDGFREVNSYVNVENHNVRGNSLGTPKREESKVTLNVGKVEDKGVRGAEHKKDAITLPKENGYSNSGSSERSMNLRVEAEPVGNVSNNEEDDSSSNQNQDEKRNTSLIPQTFVGTEIFEGKAPVTAVDGMQLHEDFLDRTEISKLVSYIDDVRAAGKRGKLQGQTHLLLKRPMKGHGRELIQFGLPIEDAPTDDDILQGNWRDLKVESIPPLLQNVIDRLLGTKVLTTKPNSVIVDIYNEGDHSQPCTWTPCYGRPFSVLSLTECDMVFGSIISVDPPSNYKGSLNLSLVPGSLLVMQRTSSDPAKYALPSIQKQRILITFTNSQPKRSMPSDSSPRVASPSFMPPSHWGPPPTRSSPNHHVRHPAPSKHYSTTGVLPGPPIIRSPNGVPQFLIPKPVTMPSGSTGWAPPHPRQHLPARLPVPGTGVFLPPGSGNSTAHQISSNTADLTSHSTTTGNGKLEGKVQRSECNGSSALMNEGEHENENVKNGDADNPAGEV